MVMSSQLNVTGSHTTGNDLHSHMFKCLNVGPIPLFTLMLPTVADSLAARQELRCATSATLSV